MKKLAQFLEFSKHSVYCGIFLMLKYVFKALILFIFSTEGTEAQASEINRSFTSQVMQRKRGTYVS